MLTDPPKKFTSIYSAGCAEALKENVTTTAAKLT